MMMLTSTYLLALEGSEAAAEALKSAFDLNERTTESWQRIWDSALSPTSGGLWLALVHLGQIIAALSIIYLALKEIGEIQRIGSWFKLAELFVWPLTIVLFLGHDGSMLANSVKLIHSIGYSQVQAVLNTSLGQVTFEQAVQQVKLNSLSAARFKELYGECAGEVGDALTQCWNSKTLEAQEFLNQIGTGADLSASERLLTFIKGRVPAISLSQGAIEGAKEGGSNGGLLGGLTAALQGAFVQLMQDQLLPIIESLLYAMQWAFVNCLEAALLLTAMFAPISLGLSILPISGRAILAWGVGFISLFGVQLGYNIIVGIVATVLVDADAQIATDLGFALFLSVFSPVLALLIAGGGGVALFQGISRSTGDLVGAVGSFVNLAVSLIK